MAENSMSEYSYAQMNEFAHQADSFSERGRKRKEDMDCWVQPCHQSLVTFTKFTESLCLRLKNVRNGLRTFAGIELRSKGMGVEVFSR
jgi:hypothetical protein